MRILFAQSPQLSMVVDTEPQGVAGFIAQQARMLWEAASPAPWREDVTATFAYRFSAACAWNIKAFIVMLFAQAFHRRWPITLRALRFLRWPAAFSAQQKAVFGLVLMARTAFTAFLAHRSKSRYLAGVPLTVMNNAMAPSEMTATTAAVPTWSVEQGVFFNVFAQFKVLEAVIVAYLVNVMHALFLSQIAAKLFLHYQAVLHHVATAIRIRMVGLFHFHVSTGINPSFARFEIWPTLSFHK